MEPLRPWLGFMPAGSQARQAWDASLSTRRMSCSGSAGVATTMRCSRGIHGVQPPDRHLKRSGGSGSNERGPLSPAFQEGLTARSIDYGPSPECLKDGLRERLSRPWSGDGIVPLRVQVADAPERERAAFIDHCGPSLVMDICSWLCRHRPIITTFRG